MTPIEALVQIVQSAELNPAASVNGLGRLARVALRDSGTHGLLFVEYVRDARTILCWCGWEWADKGDLVAVGEIIATHVQALEVEA